MPNDLKGETCKLGIFNSNSVKANSTKLFFPRERIKESCDQLRFLLPSVAGKKSDMASVSYLWLKFKESSWVRFEYSAVLLWLCLAKDDFLSEADQHWKESSVARNSVTVGGGNMEGGDCKLA